MGAHVRVASQHAQLDRAYRQGLRAGLAGKALTDNPYEPRRLVRSFTPYMMWGRGWMAGSRDRTKTNMRAETP